MEHAEAEIRRLDNQLRDAMLRSDVVALGHLCSEDFVVTNPFHQILNKRQALDAVQSGKIKHTSFEREIEYLRVFQDTAVVVGRETVVDTGPTIYRRYTEVWIQQDGCWQVVARHTHVIAQD